MKGGGKCSICGSIGVSKASCPLNPSSKNPQPGKHPLANSKNKDSSNKADNTIAPVKQEVTKQEESKSLYGIIEGVLASCPEQEQNLELLKINIKDKKIISKTKKKSNKDSSLNVEPDLNLALLQQDVKKQKDKKSKNKKPAPKKPKKGKSVINLKDYLVPGYIMEEKQFSVTVKKQLLSDEANAIVVLVTDNRDEGKEYVLKAELFHGANKDQQIHNEVNVMNMLFRNTHYQTMSLHLKDKDITEGGIPFLKKWGSGGTAQIEHVITNGPKVRCLIEEKLDESLSQYAKKGVTIPLIKEIGREYLKILQYIHSRGYVHSDIKPPNLMLKHDGGDIKYYIIDFGITTRYTIKGLPHKGQGTPVYQSIYCEEVSVNKAKRFISRLEDVEALGYILLELSTGSLPWSEKDKPLGSRLKSKLGAEEYAEKIKDSNLRTAVIQMISAHKKEFSQEPEYKNLIKLLQ